jgi:glycosyltransferase involved in cell wall biosynthesis
MSDGHQGRPLVSFILLAYKQEQFVREAVAGALAQTYSPLEIILSDDCSPDGTFAIMQEMATAYRGPHNIILNRNPNNLGIGAHLSRVMELAGGEMIVGSAGDDVSLPNRVIKLFESGWINFPQAGSVYSGMHFMDNAGRLIPNGVAHLTPQHSRNIVEAADCIRVGVPGCTHAYRKELFEVFGPLPTDVVNEDEALAFRSLLLGGIRHVPESLVHYRRHDQNISGRSEGHWNLQRVREEYRRRVVRDRAVFNSWLKDVRLARSRNLRSVQEVDEAERRILDHLRYLSLELHLVGMNIFRAVLAVLWWAAQARQPRWALKAFVRTQIPMPIRTLRSRFLGRSVK